MSSSWPAADSSSSSHTQTPSSAMYENDSVGYDSFYRDSKFHSSHDGRDSRGDDDSREGRPEAHRPIAPPNSVIGIFGLSPMTTDDRLREEFSKFGAIHKINLIFDRETGRSKGFAFVYYDSIDVATKALEAMNNTELDGRTIRVDFSNTARPFHHDGGGDGRQPSQPYHRREYPDRYHAPNESFRKPREGSSHSYNRKDGYSPSPPSSSSSSRRPYPSPSHHYPPAHHSHYHPKGGREYYESDRPPVRAGHPSQSSYPSRHHQPPQRRSPPPASRPYHPPHSPPYPPSSHSYNRSMSPRERSRSPPRNYYNSTGDRHYEGGSDRYSTPPHHHHNYHPRQSNPSIKPGLNNPSAYNRDDRNRHPVQPAHPRYPDDDHSSNTRHFNLNNSNNPYGYSRDSRIIRPDPPLPMSRKFTERMSRSPSRRQSPPPPPTSQYSSRRGSGSISPQQH